MGKFKFFYMNAAEVLDTTIAIYKKSFAQQIAIAAIMAAVGIVLFLLVTFFVMVFGAVAFANALAFDAFSGGFLAFLIIVGMIYLLGIAAFASMQYAACMVVTKQAFFGQKLSVGKAFGESFRALGRMFTATLAVILTYIPVVALIFAALFSFINTLMGTIDFLDLGAFFGTANSISQVILLLIGLILGLVIIFLIVIGFLNLVQSFVCMAIPASLFEKRWFFGAIGRSAALSKRNYFPIFGILILNVLMIMGIQYSLSGVFDIVAAFLPFAAEFLPVGAIAALSIVNIFGTIASLALLVLMIPIEVIFVTVLYMNQRIKHEGMDIEMGLEELGAAQGWTL